MNKLFDSEMSFFTLFNFVHTGITKNTASFFTQEMLQIIWSCKVSGKMVFRLTCRVLTSVVLKD